MKNINDIKADFKQRYNLELTGKTTEEVKESVEYMTKRIKDQLVNVKHLYLQTLDAVSYTHLTLPTKRIV